MNKFINKILNLNWRLKLHTVYRKGRAIFPRTSSHPAVLCDVVKKHGYDIPAPFSPPLSTRCGGANIVTPNWCRGMALVGELFKFCPTQKQQRETKWSNRSMHFLTFSCFFHTKKELCMCVCVWSLDNLWLLAACRVLEVFRLTCSCGRIYGLALGFYTLHIHEGSVFVGQTKAPAAGCQPVRCFVVF